MMSTKQSQITEFAQQAEAKFGIQAGDYWQLHSWSVQHPEQFWGLVYDYFGITPSRPCEKVFEPAQMPNQHWFVGAKLNYADAVLRWKDLPGPAIISVTEGGERTETSWPQLAHDVRAFAHTLHTLGVQPGDRVAAYVTNCAETLIAMVGCASVGAIWAACAPDYGPDAAGARLAQLEPKVLISVTAYEWSGKVFDRREALEALVERLKPSSVIIKTRFDKTFDTSKLAQSLGESHVLSWDDAVATTADDERVEQVDAEHPLWVLFSSGTTGVPKGIMHGHAGVLATHLAVMGLQQDIRPGDRFFWYTTPNWMMWNIVAAALLVGATAVTYEGSPAHPSPARMWDLVRDEGVRVFGTSPGFLLMSKQAGLRPGDSQDGGGGLEKLEQIGLTGAPAAPSLFEWVHDAVGPNVQVLSLCGGTDVVSGFIGGAPNLPIYDGELSGPLLGVDAKTYNADGEQVHDEVGELVITTPYPSMPVKFWNDDDGAKYRAAYFETFPGVWRQGDWATNTSRGSFIVHGRSDSTLNRGGVRIGSSDIYSIVEGDSKVAEALVIGAEMPDGSYRMPIFLVPAAGETLGESDFKRLATKLRDEGSPRHVPDEWHVVEAVPHTRTGKKMEIPMKRILQGSDPAKVLDLGAVDRADLIDGYVQLAQKWGTAR